MLGLGFLGFTMLVIVLEFIVPGDFFLPCINNDLSHFPEWHVNTAEAENFDGRSTSPALILSR